MVTIKYILCKIIKHKISLVEYDSFTGQEYELCARCHSAMPRYIVQ